jgi:hypothetical protein
MPKSRKRRGGPISDKAHLAAVAGHAKRKQKKAEEELRMKLRDAFIAGYVACVVSPRELAKGERVHRLAAAYTKRLLERA